MASSEMTMGCFDLCYPFPAVVGQDAAKRALMLCAVNPAIGGVLLSGDKGTAKSTLVRGLSRLAAGAFVEVPLNVTEDRLVGSLDVEAAVKEGRVELSRGLLEEADGGFLYVDEVNLLSGHVVDVLLEVGSSGVDLVEREGISVARPARFVLVGSMNPEEGSLRPEFIDRFGLYVRIAGEKDPAVRARIIRRRLDYEADPAGFCAGWDRACREGSAHIAAARTLLPSVVPGPDVIAFAAGIAHEGLCEGHRAEIVLCETARALAAWGGRKEVTDDDVRIAARFALPHRIHEEVKVAGSAEPVGPGESAESGESAEPGKIEAGEEPAVARTVAAELEKSAGCEEPATSDDAATDGDATLSVDDARRGIAPDSEESGWDEAQTDLDGAAAGGWEDIEPMQDRMVLRLDAGRLCSGSGTGKRLKVRSYTMRGRYVRACLPKGKPHDIAVDATIRAAALHGHTVEVSTVADAWVRGRFDVDTTRMAIVVHDDDMRERVRESRTGIDILFLVDASGSMGARRRMGAVKGAVMSLLSDAYEKRDRVALIAFRDDRAEVLLEFTRSVEMAQRSLRDLRTGGRTPLAAGLEAACDLLVTDRIKDRDAVRYLVIVSDGRANVGLLGERSKTPSIQVEGSGAPGTSSDRDPFDDALVVAQHIRAEKVQTLVLDTEIGYMRLGFGSRLADALGAEHIELSEVTGKRIVSELARRVT